MVVYHDVLCGSLSELLWFYNGDLCGSLSELLWLFILPLFVLCGSLSELLWLEYNYLVSYVAL